MININNYKRIFFIEPNLIRGMGHVVEFPISLNKYLGDSSNIFFIANKNVYSNVRKRINRLKGLISKSSFQELGSGGKYFNTDLKRIDKKYNLNSKDLIVVLTSYWNEIKGANTYLLDKKINCPKIVLWVHQIYPPQENFKRTLDTNFIKQVKLGWKDILNVIHSQIVLVCTPSKEMKKYLKSITLADINFLPLPYECIKPIKSNNTDSINIAFLGDGRYEKGLIMFLQAISDHIDIAKFHIQKIYSRGYNSEEKNDFNDLVKKLSKYKNIKFYNKSLFPDKFVKFISSMDLIILPYHPRSYDKRVSGIFIQAMQHGVPCITSDGTWIAEEIKKNKCGVIFKYNINKDYKYNSIYLNRAIMNTIKNIKVFKSQTRKSMLTYREIHSAKNFINVLQKIIN